MWHASVSLQHRKHGKLDDPEYVETQSVLALDGVGGDHEWWLWTDRRIGHLRVPVTDEEAKLIPPGIAVADAGEAGPLRPRTRP